MADVRAEVNYFDPAVGRGRFDLVEPEKMLMPMVAHEVTIRDMREAAPGELSLDGAGFVLARHRSAAARRPEMLDANMTAQAGLPPINRAYYEELLPLI